MTKPWLSASEPLLNMNLDRRDIIKTGIAGAGILSVPGILAFGQQVAPDPMICIFSKCLQFLDYLHLAMAVKEIGFDGIDLTVRKDGHVLPENVKNDLPRVVKAAQEKDVLIPMIATDIVNTNDITSEDIIETAASQGIKYYRTGRLKYFPAKSIMQNLDDYKFSLERLEKLNRKHQMHGCIQNHSGPYNMVGAPVWDLHYLLKDFDPEFVGIQYDIMHATVEGAYSWPLGLKLLSPWIKTINIKDFIWEKDHSGTWKRKMVPLGRGMVDLPKFINEIKRNGINATYSMHYEYDLGGAELGKKNPDMDTERIFQNIKKDQTFFESQFVH